MHVGDPGAGSTATTFRASTGTSPTPLTRSGESEGIVSAASWTRKDLHHTRVLPRRNSSVSPSRDAAPRVVSGICTSNRTSNATASEGRFGMELDAGSGGAPPTSHTGTTTGDAGRDASGTGTGPRGAARKARRGSRRRVTPRAPSRGARWTPRARKGTTPGASSGAPSATKQAPSRPDARARRAVGLWRSKHTPRRRVVQNDAAPPRIVPVGTKLPNVFQLSDWPAHAGAFLRKSAVILSVPLSSSP